MNIKHRRVLGYLRTQDPEMFLPIARIQTHAAIKDYHDLISILAELEHLGQVVCRRNDRQIIKGARVTQAGNEAWSGSVRSGDANVVAQLAELRTAVELLQEAVSDSAPPRKSALSPERITWALDTVLKTNSVVQLIRQHFGM